MFINAVNEVIRKNAESYLTDEHIKKIANAFFDYTESEGFCTIVQNTDILKENSTLNISYYVSAGTSNLLNISLEDALLEWEDASMTLHNSINTLTSLFHD